MANTQSTGGYQDTEWTLILWDIGEPCQSYACSDNCHPAERCPEGLQSLRFAAQLPVLDKN